MTSVMSAFAATASMSGVTPECRNVLSPMMPMAGRTPASEAPLAMPTDAPMQTHDSMAPYGGSAPSV